jgi:hypothetical protein
MGTYPLYFISPLFSQLFPVFLPKSQSHKTPCQTPCFLVKKLVNSRMDVFRFPIIYIQGLNIPRYTGYMKGFEKYSLTKSRHALLPLLLGSMCLLVFAGPIIYISGLTIPSYTGEPCDLKEIGLPNPANSRTVLFAKKHGVQFRLFYVTYNRNFYKSKTNSFCIQ